MVGGHIFLSLILPPPRLQLWRARSLTTLDTAHPATHSTEALSSAGFSPFELVLATGSSIQDGIPVL